VLGISEIGLKFDYNGEDSSVSAMKDALEMAIKNVAGDSEAEVNILAACFSLQVVLLEDLTGQDMHGACVGLITVARILGRGNEELVSLQRDIAEQLALV